MNVGNLRHKYTVSGSVLCCHNRELSAKSANIWLSGQHVTHKLATFPAKSTTWPHTDSVALPAATADYFPAAILATIMATPVHITSATTANSDTKFTDVGTASLARTISNHVRRAPANQNLRQGTQPHNEKCIGIRICIACVSKCIQWQV